ncbi:MAG: hypothetical protein MUC97_16800 [Bernardetiaceae bacterium]|jgi:hypothetical protein|nr:hypothetical protein [Bernardetiaceae bacterium]
METTVNLRLDELTPTVIEALQALAQGHPEAEITIIVRTPGPAGFTPKPHVSPLPVANPVAAFLGQTDDEEGIDPFSEMTGGKRV